MATQNSRRILNILKKSSPDSTLSDVAKDLNKAGVLAPHFKVGQEVYPIMCKSDSTDKSTVVHSSWRVVKSTVTKIMWDGKEFTYYIRYNDSPFDEYPPQAYPPSHRDRLLYDSKHKAQRECDRLNSIKVV